MPVSAAARGPVRAAADTPVAAGLPPRTAGLPGDILASHRLGNALEPTLRLASPPCPPGARRKAPAPLRSAPGPLVPVTPHPPHEGIPRIATAPEGARVCLMELAWAGVHPGGLAPPDPCQPKRIVVRLVFYCRAVCRGSEAVEGFPWPGRHRGWAQLGGRSPGLHLARCGFPSLEGHAR